MMGLGQFLVVTVGKVAGVPMVGASVILGLTLGVLLGTDVLAVADFTLDLLLGALEVGRLKLSGRYGVAGVLNLEFLVVLGGGFI